MATAAAAQRLSLREKIAYGAGDLGYNFYWTTISAFGMYFFTDVFGISPAAAGTLFLVSRIVDAFTDPMMGAFADRTRSKFGRFRPFIVGAIVPLAIMGVLTFSTPDLGEAQKLIYAYVCFNLLMLAYTASNIPYSALSGVMSADGQERATLNGFRFFGGFLGGSIVTYCSTPLVEWFGKGDAQVGWPLTMALYGGAACLIMVLLFVNTKERIEPPAGQKTSPFADIGDLLKNRPWMVLFVISLVIMVTITLRMSTSAYFMRYVVGREDLINEFLTVYGIALACGALMTPVLTRFIDKRKLMMILMTLVAVLSASFFFIPADQIALMFIVQVLIGLCLGPKSPLTFSMYADTADFTEYTTGRRATAMTYAAATFSQKLGGALASFAIGGALAGVGYIANTAQSGEAQQTIRLLISVGPAIMALVSVGVLTFYHLSREKMAEVTTELLRRREEADPT